MYSSGNARVYQLGATVLIVGQSQIATVNPIKGQIGGFFHINGAVGGSLAIVPGASTGVANGYLIGTTEVVELQGPAQFFLAAGGATMSVGYVYRYSAGLSATL